MKPLHQAIVTIPIEAVAALLSELVPPGTSFVSFWLDQERVNNLHDQIYLKARIECDSLSVVIEGARLPEIPLRISPKVVRVKRKGAAA